jgi:hypothetical protein
MLSPRLFVCAPEQASVHPRILTISPSKANRVFAPRRRVPMQSRRTLRFMAIPVLFDLTACRDAGLPCNGSRTAGPDCH